MSRYAEKIGIIVGRKMLDGLTESSVFCDVRSKFPC